MVHEQEKTTVPVPLLAQAGNSRFSKQLQKLYQVLQLKSILLRKILKKTSKSFTARCSV